MRLGRPQCEERARQREAARAEYEKSPLLCANGCGKPVPYGRYVKDGKFCSSMCSIENVTKLKTGRANPHGPNRTLPTTANWNGKIVKLRTE